MIFAATIFQAHAQNPSAHFAKWKNNAQGVYTLTHDDYASFWIDGIQEYADTIAYNRGVKFTFGIITGSCDEADWTVAKRLIAHGHEAMSHTHTHACNHVTTICPNGGWNYAWELDQSTNLIFTKTGSYPRYFIWPYDVYDQASKDYLKNNLHYYGGRGGANGESLDASQLNGRDIPDFFNTNFSIHATTTPLSELNALVDLAIQEGKWGVREVHGVNDLSYASIPLADYRNHCDHIKTKVDAGLLWNANASDVTTYLMQARAFVPAVTHEPQYGRIKISWNNPVLDVSDLRSTVTLNVKLDGLTGFDYAYQNSTSLGLVNHGDSVSVNCFPHKGEVYLYNYDPTTVNNDFSFDQYKTLVRQGTQDVLYSISMTDGDEYIWSCSDAGTTIQASGHQALVDFNSGSGNGKVSVYVIKDGKVGLAKSIDVTVLAVNDITYACPLPSQATFSITNQNNKKYLWLDAPEGGNELAFAPSFTRSTFTPDTFYIARKDDSVQVKVELGPSSWYTLSAIMARKITVQESLLFRSITFLSKQAGPQTVDIYEADGQTIVFSATKNVADLYQIITLPLNINLTPGDYYIKVSAESFNNSSQPDALEFPGLMTLYPGGYGVSGDGSINFSDAKTHMQSIQIGLLAVKPAVVYPERVAVYMRPTPMAAPASYTGSQAVCANTTQTYAVPNVPGYSPVYHYTDDQLDTTITSATAPIRFRDRGSNGTLTVVYKNSCGQLSAPLTIAIEVIKPALANLSGPTIIDLPGNAVYTYSQPAGSTFTWNLASGSSVTAQSATSTELRFQTTFQPQLPTYLSYTVSKNGCSKNYTLQVSFNRVYPVIEIISPAEGERFTEGDEINLLASLNADFGESVYVYFKVVCSDQPQAVTTCGSFTAPYQCTYYSMDLAGSCYMIVYTDEGINVQQRQFYIDQVMGNASSDKHTLTAYPNPTSGKLFVPADWSKGLPVTCTATNSMGQVYTVAYNQIGDQLQVDFSPLASGIYNLMLSSGDKRYRVPVVKFDGQ